jgi:Tol biopolymer transport system component
MPASDALSVGARVGRYEIVAFVDAGGMGEVYRARDTELGRVVAIKVLPAAAVERPDRLHRFELEARTAAALNHPNILAIYDVGQHHGSPYLVTEWLDGTTLRTWLEGPSLPLRRAIEFGIQIADALAAAHALGVVHRDIKPENVFVTTDGRLKVLDFGLAKLADDDQSGRTKTLAGTVLGTLGYLSPEQASGQATDHRADIFSTGAVLFELVTHRRAFTGATPAEMLAAVLGHDPTSEVAPGTGSRARVLNLVRRCLEKAPERRFQSAADLSMVLANELADEATGSPATTAHGARRWRLATLAGVLLSGALAAVLWEQGRLARAASPTAPPPVHRLTISLPADLSLTYGPPIALSPDGAQIAVVMSAGDGQRLFVRRLDRDTVDEVPGTDGAEFPFFSPDGGWLGFWARNRLWRVSLRGGAPVVLADSPDAPFRGADWGDTILFAPQALGPLSQVEPDSGTVRRATALDGGREEYSHRWPQILAGGGAWLYTALSGPVPGGTAAVMLHVPATGETRTLLPNATYGRYVGDGLLVFVRDGQLFVTRFDAQRFVVDGEPAPLPDPIASRSVSGATLVSVAANGSAAFVKSASESSRRLLWVDLTGVEQPINAAAASYSAPRLSPDGRRVAVTIRGSLGSGDVWTIDLSTHVRTRLTTDGRTNGVVEWSPDGRRLIAGMPRLATDASAAPRGLNQGPSNLFVVTADGVGAAEAFLPPPVPSGAGEATSVHPSYVGSWGRDGIVTFGYGTDLWSFRPGDLSATPIMTLPGMQVGPRVSPNGRWLAYVSNESGRFEAFLTTYPQSGRRWQVSDGGGQEVVWSRDSRELYFRQNHRMMAVTLDPRGGVPSGRPRVIFDGRYFSEPNNPGIPHFDVAADGRFLMVSSEAGPPDQVQLVLGWRSYLAGLLAGAR